MHLCRARSTLANVVFEPFLSVLEDALEKIAVCFILIYIMNKYLTILWVLCAILMGIMLVMLGYANDIR